MRESVSRFFLWTSVTDMIVYTPARNLDVVPNIVVASGLNPSWFLIPVQMVVDVVCVDACHITTK